MKTRPEKPVVFIKRPSDFGLPNEQRGPKGGPSVSGPPASVWLSKADEVELYFFALPSAKKNLQDLCDKFLNRPSRGEWHYDVTGDHVFLVFAKTAKMQLLGGPPFPYDEAGIWIPIRAQQDQNSGMTFFPYYYFVGKGAYPLIAPAREAYGWPAEPADVIIKKTNDLLSVVTELLKEFGRNKRAECAQLLELRPVNTAKRDDLLSGLMEIVSGLGISENLSALFTPAKLPVESPVRLPVKFVFLKQFRDAAHPYRACYQAGVEAEGTTSIGGSWNPVKFSLKITPADSHPLIEELGLGELGPGNTIDVCGMHLDNVTIELMAGEEKWPKLRSVEPEQNGRPNTDKANGD